MLWMYHSSGGSFDNWRHDPGQADPTAEALHYRRRLLGRSRQRGAGDHDHLLAAGLALAGSSALSAEDVDEHAGHQPPKEHEVTSQTHLQKNMQTMRELMAKIQEATDAAEKKRLLGVHMLAMQEQIKALRAMSATGGEHDHSGGDAEGKQGGMMGKGGMMMKK